MASTAEALVIAHSSVAMKKLIRRSCAVALVCLGAATVSCGGESPVGPPSAGPAVTATPSSSSVRGTRFFDITVRGASATDSVEVWIAGGIALFTRSADTLVSAMMPAGPRGSVTLELRVRNAIGVRSTTGTLMRIESAVVANPAVFIDSVQSDLEALAAEVEALAVPEGISPEAFEHDVALARKWVDSAATLFAALNPTERAAVAAIVADVAREASEEASLRAVGLSYSLSAHRGAFTNSTESCYESRTEALSCLDALLYELESLNQTRLRWGAVLTLIGGVSWGSNPLFGGALGAIGTSMVMLELVKINDRVLESVFSPAIFRSLGLDSPESSELSIVAAHGASHLLVSPNVAVAIPITLTTSNALPSDAADSPLVTRLLAVFASIAEVRAKVMEYTLDFFEIPASGLPSTTQRSLQSPVAASEISIVEVSDPTVTVTLEDQGGTPALRITGNPGAGKDITVSIEADGGDAGWAELELPIRYESAPDMHDWAASVLTGNWTGRFTTPSIQDYCPAPGGYAFPSTFSSVVSGERGSPTRNVEATFTYSCAGSGRTRTVRLRLSWTEEAGWRGLRLGDVEIPVDVLGFTSGGLTIGQTIGGEYYTEVFTPGA